VFLLLGLFVSCGDASADATGEVTKEKQADEYASSFCRKFKYNLDDIERFINQCPTVDFDRIKILRNKK